jgi:hypothetical protein
VGILPAQAPAGWEACATCQAGKPELRNLIIFVTARLVTPGGLPLHEEEEGLEQPILPEVPLYKK